MTSVFDFVRQKKTEPQEVEEEEDVVEEPAKKKASVFDVVRSRPKQFEPEPSFVQKIASSAPSQAALGTFKRFTWPFDVLKMAAIGEGLADLDELEEIAQREGVPFDRQEYLQRVMQAAETLPTQDMAEKFVMEKTGLDLSPKGFLGKLGRKSGEFFGLAGKTGQGLAQTGKSALGATTGAMLSQGLEELGLPQAIADLPGLAMTGGVGAGKIEPRKLTGEAQKARETADKFDLRKIAGTEYEKPPKITPVVSPKRQEKVTQELEESTKKAVEKIIESKLPIKRLQKQGFDLEDIYTRSYDMARDRAVNKPSRVSLNPLMNWIQKEYSRINKHALSPSASDKIALKILEDEYVALHPLLKGRPTAEQVLNQYQKFNENLKGIYKKPEFSGAEDEIRRVYGAMNDKLMESLEQAKRYDILVPFKVANKAFHETSKLNQVESILEKAFDEGFNPKNLSKILDNKRNSKFLARSLGREAITDMREIADYGKRAHEKVISKLQNPKTVGQYFAEMTPAKALLLFFKHGPGAPIAIPYEVIKGGTQRAIGMMMTRPSTSKAYKNFLKGAASGSEQAFKQASKGLTKAINDEFGSEDEFLRLLEEEEEESTSTNPSNSKQDQSQRQ